MGGGARTAVGRVTAAPAVTIRQAAAGDIDAIHAIELASFSDPWRRNGFRDLILGGTSRVAVATTPDGVVVAFGILVQAADEAEITNVAVAPTARRGGIGTAMVGHLAALAVAGGARAVYLEVRESNAAARALYAGLSFAEVSRRRNYYRNPEEDAVVMRRGLANA